MPPVSPEMVAALQEKLKAKLLNQAPYPKPVLPEPIRLADYKDDVTTILEDDQASPMLLSPANDNYYKLSEFIQAMNPYGGQAILFPDLEFASSIDRTDIETLQQKLGIQVAGWLRRSYAQKPKSSSDEEMNVAERQQCFYWDFRYPDDPETKDAHGNIQHGGEMLNVQITKALRIPFIYRREDKTLLLGHLLIGYEGAGSM